MRAFLLVALLVLVPLVPAGEAHPPASCEPRFVFPTLAGWLVPAGGTSSFYLPPGTFGTFLTAVPLDVTAFFYTDCAADDTCHHHGWVGPLACGSSRATVLELHNPGPQAAPVALAVGRCLQVDVCDAL